MTALWKMFFPCLLLFSVFFCTACGKQIPAPIVNQSLPDVARFNEDYYARQEQLQAERRQVEEAEKSRIWIPSGNYTLNSQFTMLHIRVDSADVSSGTAKVTYMIGTAGEPSTTLETVTARLTKTDQGNGYLEYQIHVNDSIQLIFSGTFTDRINKVRYNGTLYSLESQGKG